MSISPACWRFMGVYIAEKPRKKRRSRAPAPSWTNAKSVWGECQREGAGEREKDSLPENPSFASRRFWLRPPADEAFWLVDLLSIIASLESRREEADQWDKIMSEKPEQRQAVSSLQKGEMSWLFCLLTMALGKAWFLQSPKSQRGRAAVHRVCC